MASTNRFSKSFLRQSLGMPIRDSQQWQPSSSDGASVVSGAVKRPPSRKDKKASGFGPPSSQRKTIGPSSQVQRKTIGFGSSRPSAGRSSIYGSSSQLKKDPRPLSEKSYQVTTIKNLIKFLNEKEYERTLTVKELQMPTCKEFLHIFNFLMERIDPEFVISGMNIVEEVPSTLRMLGYPFNVSKNHLLNVGSPHSWPILLGALSWLTDCCTIDDNTSQILFSRGQGFDDEEDARFETEYDIEELLYAAYIKYGEDSKEYQKLVTGRRETSWSECEHYERQLEDLKQNRAELSKEIQELSKSSVPALQVELQQIKSDNEELRHHLDTEVIPAINSVEKAKADSDLHASEVEVQIEASKEKIHELEEQIRRQPMSASDADELHWKIKEAEDMLEKKRMQQEEGLKRISELQIQHNKSLQLIDSKCQEVNEILHSLAASLPDLASISFLDYDKSKRADLEVLQRLVAHAKHFRDDIVPKLDQQVAKDILDYEGKIFAAESTLSTLHTEIVKKQLEVDNLQHTHDMAKESLDQKRKLKEEAMKAGLAEKYALEKNLLALKQKLQAESVAEKNYLATQEQCKEEIVTMAKELKAKSDELKELIVLLTKFIEALHDHQHGIRSNVNELVEQFRELKIPTVHPKTVS